MSADRRALVEQFWDTLYRRDFDAVGAYFAADGEYTDMPTPAEDVARAPRRSRRVCGSGSNRSRRSRTTCARSCATATSR